MKIEFKDGSQIDVIAIFGGPQLINGVTRDTLRIEVDPESVNIEDLKSIFMDPSKTSRLFSYTEECQYDKSVLQKNVIGEGYNIFVSVCKETRKVYQPPGVLAEEATEDINVVTISQMTYQEYQDSIVPDKE